MNLEKDRKVVLMIPHSDDELIAMMSILSRHPNPKNIYCITLVNENVLQNLINFVPPELEYGTVQINLVLKIFGVPIENCFRVHKTHDIVEHCFNIMSLIKPNEVYVPLFKDGHDDHQMFWHISKRVQTKLLYKIFSWIIHIKQKRPKPEHIIKLTKKEQKIKKYIRRIIYPGKIIEKHIEEKFFKQEEFYDDKCYYYGELKNEDISSC